MAIKHKDVLLFDANETEFKTKGLGVINCIVESSITEQEDECSKLEIEVHEQCMLFDKLQKMNIILANGQLYRIWDTEYNSKDKTIEVFARHIMYDMSADLLYNKQFKGTLQNVVQSMIKSASMTHKYKFVYNMGSLASTKIEYKVDKENIIDAIFNVIKKFEEENQGTKVELKMDNLELGIFLFEEDKIVADTEVQARATEKIGTVYNCTSLHVRNGAGTKYKAIGYVNKGDNVVILGTPNRYWYKIKTKKGLIGYSSSSYITNIRDNSSSSIVDTPLVKSYGLGRDTGIRLDTAKIENITIQDDFENFCTRLLATGKDNLYGYYTCSEGKMGYPFYITKEANFSEANTKTKLANEAKKYLQLHSMNIKNIEVEVNKIFGTDLYQSLLLYKDLRLYDWVWVKHPSLANHYERFKICKVIRDASGKLISIELGQLIAPFAKRLKWQMSKNFERNIVNYATTEMTYTNEKAITIPASNTLATIATFNYSTSANSNSINLQISLDIDNSTVDDSIKFSLYINDTLIKNHTQKVYVGSNSIDFMIPIANTADYNTLVLKARGTSKSHSIKADNIRLKLSGNNIRTDMELVEV